MAPPFRADQIGSLLRPAELLEARSNIASPDKMYEIATEARIKHAEQEAVAYAVRKQLDLSIRPIVSGEYGRHIFYGGFFETLQGMKTEPNLPIPDAFRTDFPTTAGLAKMGAKTRAAVIATGKISYVRSAYLEEWKQLRSFLPESKWHECKITMPAPSYQHIQLKPGTAFTEASGYSSDSDYFADLAKACSAELKTLYEAGVRNVQIDDPHLTYFCSEQFLSGCAQDGVDTDELLDLYIDAHNQLLAGKPVDLHMGMHLCRGNMSGSTHWVSGSYERIAEKLFNKTDYDTYYLEFDDIGRTGGFDSLRFLPRGKNVVLGVVSTKQAELEDLATLKAQVYQAAEVLARSQGVSRDEALDCLAVSPQCGFSSLSTAGGKGFTMELMWKKLELVRDVARSVWKDAV